MELDGVTLEELRLWSSDALKHFLSIRKKECGRSTSMHTHSFASTAQAHWYTLIYTYAYMWHYIKMTRQQVNNTKWNMTIKKSTRKYNGYVYMAIFLLLLLKLACKVLVLSLTCKLDTPSYHHNEWYSIGLLLMKWRSDSCTFGLNI